MPRKKRTSPAEKELPPSGVQTEIHVSADDPEKAAETMRRFGGAPVEDNGDAKSRSKEERIIELLDDPSNQVVVKRTHPKEYEDIQTRCEVFREQCPIGWEDLKHMTFEEHGGHRYQIRVHDQQGNTLDAINIENPETTVPKLDPQEIDDGSDPFEFEVEPDAMEKIEKGLEQELDTLSKQQKIDRLRETVESMKDRRRGSAKGDGNNDAKFDELTRKLDELKSEQREDVLRAEIKQLRDKVEASQAQPAHDPEKEQLQRDLNEIKQKMAKQGEEDRMLAYMKSSDAKFETLVKQINDQKTDALSAKIDALADKKEGPSSSLDQQLEHLLKFKKLLGSDDSKSSRVEELVWELALDKLGGSGVDPEDEEDVFKFAIKQLTPVLKTYAEKSLQKEGKEQPTQEDYNRAVAEGAKKLAKDAVARMTREGKIIVVPEGKKETLPPKKEETPAPQPKPEPEAKPEPTTEPPPKPEPEPKPEPPQEREPDIGEEERDMDVPPSPQSPAYDRKTNVNWVLDNILQEARDRIPQDKPEDSFIVADCLDRLDDVVLGKILAVSTGTDLEQLLLESGGDVDKVTEVKKIGKDSDVRRWLRRIVFTVQEEYGEAVEKAEKKAAAKPKTE